MLKPNKLKLNRETIRTLSSSRLALAAGGIPPNYTDACTDRCVVETDTCICIPPPSDACTHLCTQYCLTEWCP